MTNWSTTCIGPWRCAEGDSEGRGHQGVLSIPTIRDRVVQGALKHILEPIFESGAPLGVCFARILCVLKIARFHAATAVPSRIPVPWKHLSLGSPIGHNRGHAERGHRKTLQASPGISWREIAKKLHIGAGTAFRAVPGRSKSVS